MATTRTKMTPIESKTDPVKAEIDRLMEIFSVLPENKKKVAEGLIVQAARLRVRLNYLWDDIQKNGEFEWFNQSDKTEPYQRERPVSKTFTATDKNFQTIMRQLLDMCPDKVERDSLADFLNAND